MMTVKEGTSHKCVVSITSPLPAVLITSCVAPATGSLHVFLFRANIEVRERRRVHEGKPVELPTKGQTRSLMPSPFSALHYGKKVPAATPPPHRNSRVDLRVPPFDEST